MVDGVQNRPLGDFVEHHPLYRFVAQQVALPEDFVQVPGNGFALAVRVGGQIQGIGFGDRLGDGFDMAQVFLDRLILHGKVVFRIDRALLGDQVAHMTVGGQHFEVLAQVFLDRFRLGRRLHDDQVLAHDKSLRVTDVKVAPDRTPAREGDAPATTDRRGENSSTRRKDLTNARRFGA